MKNKIIQFCTATCFIVSMILFVPVQIQGQAGIGNSCHYGNPSPCNDAGCPDTGTDPCTGMLCDDNIGTEICMYD